MSPTNLQRVLQLHAVVVVGVLCQLHQVLHADVHPRRTAGPLPEALLGPLHPLVGLLAEPVEEGLDRPGVAEVAHLGLSGQVLGGLVGHQEGHLEPLGGRRRGHDLPQLGLVEGLEEEAVGEAAGQAGVGHVDELVHLVFVPAHDDGHVRPALGRRPGDQRVHGLAALTQPVGLVDEQHVALGALHDGLGQLHGLARVDADEVRRLDLDA